MRRHQATQTVSKMTRSSMLRYRCSVAVNLDSGGGSAVVQSCTMEPLQISLRRIKLEWQDGESGSRTGRAHCTTNNQPRICRVANGIIDTEQLRSGAAAAGTAELPVGRRFCQASERRTGRGPGRAPARHLFSLFQCSLY